MAFGCSIWRPKTPPCRGAAGNVVGGLDGLTPTADGFVTVQIGIKPERVLRFKVDSAGERITYLRVLEMNHPDYAGPVQGSANITHFFYVANSQLALGNAQTGEFATEKAKPTVVLRCLFKPHRH